VTPGSPLGHANPIPNPTSCAAQKTPRLNSSSFLPQPKAGALSAAEGEGPRLASPPISSTFDLPMTRCPDLQPICHRLMGRSSKTRTPGAKGRVLKFSQCEYSTNTHCKCKDFFLILRLEKFLGSSSRILSPSKRLHHVASRVEAQAPSRRSYPRTEKMFGQGTFHRGLALHSLDQATPVLT
jgi:hypothetical protein